MNKIKQMWRIAAHPRELRMALSGLGMRLGGDDALGGLTPQETEGLVRWVGDVARAAASASGASDGAESPGVTFIEIGTLFGFTAKAIAQRTTARVVSVDNFCWNPFGLTSGQHEQFTRRVLEGSGVELLNADAQQYLRALKPGADGAERMVFLDGDHRYEAVKAELEILKAKGLRHVAGHDFGNSLFGVTEAVRETVGEPDDVVGMCWFKTLP